MDDPTLNDLSRDEWLDVPQVADLLTVTQETVRRWIRGGQLPVLDLGAPKGGYRIRRKDLDVFLRGRYRRARALDSGQE